MLNLTDVTASYGGKPVFSSLNLSLAPGNIYILTGPSGCGKSTLLKVVAGILAPDSGRVEFLTDAVSGVPNPSCLPHVSHMPRIGYVPQNHGLLEHKTVEGNIFLPFKLGVNAKDGWQEPAVSSPEIIERLGLADFMGKYPAELSGGQRQRASLARAFVMNAEIMLLDEPFSALDAFTADACRELFLELWTAFRPLTLFITHNLDEAAALGREILIMDAGRITRFPNPALDPEGEGTVPPWEVALQLKQMIRPQP